MILDDSITQELHYTILHEDILSVQINWGTNERNIFFYQSENTTQQYM